MFADDIAILASDKEPAQASNNLEKHLDNISIWLIKWNIQVNESKSNHII